MGLYERQIVYQDTSQRWSPDASELVILKRILWALYEHPRMRVLAYADQSSGEIMLSLWAQQWPRLRRTFRFCTHAFGDRSSEGNIFDLQFIPKQERSIRLRFPESVNAEGEEPGNTMWMFEAFTDLTSDDNGALRMFLRDVGGDLVGGRESFASLCQLYYLLTQVPSSPEALEQAVSLLQEAFEGEPASSLRTRVVLTALRNPEHMGDGHAVDFLMEHLNLLDAEGIGRVASKLGRTLWSRDPERLTSLLIQAEPHSLLAAQTIADMGTDQLIEGFRRRPASIGAVLPRRTDLIEQQSLWEIPGGWTSEALRIASLQPEHSNTLAAIIAAKRSDLAGEIAGTFGRCALLRSLSEATSASRMPSEMTTWLAVATSDSRAVAEVLISDSHQTISFLASVARHTHPDFVPNAYGDDPWWTAINHSSDRADVSDRQYLCAYLLNRALGYTSRSQAQLICYAFDSVYFPALHSELSVEAWNLLSRRLLDSWFSDWDNCRRIRDAVVTAFTERQLAPIAFNRVTRDDQTFEDLARLAARSGRGRQFLKKVLQALERDDPKTYRIAVLDRII